MNGYEDPGNGHFRTHVYACPSKGFDEQNINWSNAPHLDRVEALVSGVGQHGFVAGELAFSGTEREHQLDITEVATNHDLSQGLTFILVRETRHLGDDVDKGRTVYVGSRESETKPTLRIWCNE